LSLDRTKSAQNQPLQSEQVVDQSPDREKVEEASEESTPMEFIEETSAQREDDEQSMDQLQQPNQMSFPEKAFVSGTIRKRRLAVLDPETAQSLSNIVQPFTATEEVTRPFRALTNETRPRFISNLSPM
jgi:hypothetical protein